jgi:hypothetical protein
MRRAGVPRDNAKVQTARQNAVLGIVATRPANARCNGHEDQVVSSVGIRASRRPERHHTN